MFSGLQNLVKQKKQAETAAAPTTTPSTGPAVVAPTVAADPYAAAKEAVSKRIAPSAIVASIDDATTAASVAASVSQAGVKRARSPSPSADDTASALTTSADTPSVLSEQDFESEKSRVLDAITAALTEARAVVQKELSLLKETSVKQQAKQVPLVLALPRGLAHFLEDEYILEKTDGSASSITSWPETTETALLLHLNGSEDATIKASAPAVAADEQSAVAPAAAETRAVLHVLWYRLLAQWQASLQGTLATSEEIMTGSASVTRIVGGDGDEEARIRGWSYPVYLLSVGALPDAIKYTQGQAVARALAEWRVSKGARWHYLRLMAVLSADYETLQCNSGGPSVSEALESQCYLPQALRHHLYELLLLHLTRDGNIAQAQQDYAEMAMGNANWKLGLFSAGEVHMRRSMEKVERNRIAHLLNNEPAMQMLRSMKEIVFCHITTTVPA